MSRRPELLSSVNLDSSVKSTEAHRCLVQETYSLAQYTWALLCRPMRGNTHNWSPCKNNLHWENAFAPYLRTFFSLMLQSSLKQVAAQKYLKCYKRVFCRCCCSWSAWNMSSEHRSFSVILIPGTVDHIARHIKAPSTISL